jgi:hypothetical protein
MSVSASSKNSTAVIGVPAIVSEIDLNESGTVAKRALGFKVEDAQGKIYRWAHFGASTNRGLLVSNDLSESSLVDSDNIVLAPASCVNTDDGKIGSRFVEITLASVTAGMYAGGQFGITDDTGEGYTYDIVGNTATGDPATGTFRLELARPLAVALDATSDICIMGSPYANLEGATTADIAVVGVSMATMAEGDYGWIMTKGQAVILDQGTTTIGTQVMIGSAAGSVTDLTADAVLGLNGYTLVAGDNGGHAGVRFNFE